MSISKYQILGIGSYFESILFLGMGLIEKIERDKSFQTLGINVSARWVSCV